MKPSLFIGIFKNYIDSKSSFRNNSNFKKVDFPINLPAVRTSKRAAAWTLPAGLLPTHWNMPESELMSPRIFKLWLFKGKFKLLINN